MTAKPIKPKAKKTAIEIEPPLFEGGELNLKAYLSTPNDYQRGLGVRTCGALCLEGISELLELYKHKSLGLEKRYGDFLGKFSQRDFYFNEACKSGAERGAHSLSRALYRFRTALSILNAGVNTENAWILYGSAMRDLGWVQNEIGIAEEGLWEKLGQFDGGRKKGAYGTIKKAIKELFELNPEWISQDSGVSEKLWSSLRSNPPKSITPSKTMSDGEILIYESDKTITRATFKTRVSEVKRDLKSKKVTD
ncbi:hypothetical protein [Polynucleobacter sp. Fuers-14]|uniref:hypothetical protein n=1 Tax=Polynucleobacter sp. Fuers-14 TaxID=1758364 RepID=UPI001C0AA7CE|nr:hypothetical protein [Polynucleobacter sp. Fuers-14]MBU3640827.1 hypothetical protein [Polynucleobacter sp. Fuers-14]